MIYPETGEYGAWSYINWFIALVLGVAGLLYGHSWTGSPKIITSSTISWKCWSAMP
ncbi:hypothetical protein LWM68_18235 [Niabella sp. W65]|nr:hypothetical protein [Niabella sp. W65]MCH7364518.1 hypothetical protein [Niabella sp. W65]ULT40378.1 hypothetical protein KRR40_37125 [Niabella sp. I65]